MNQHAKRCPQCGRWLPDNASVCPMCGFCYERPKSKKSGVVVLLISIFCAVVLPALSLFLLVRGILPYLEDSSITEPAQIISVPTLDTHTIETEIQEETVPSETAWLPTLPEMTPAQADAVATARAYLKDQTFSRQWLLEALENSGFTPEDALWGVEYCGTDWMMQAKESAKLYLECRNFSRQGLIEQLEYEGFTTEEAAWAVDQTGADWMQQAVEDGAFYLDGENLTREELIAILELEGFTTEQAAYAADQNGL